MVLLLSVWRHGTIHRIFVIRLLFDQSWQTDAVFFFSPTTYLLSHNIDDLFLGFSTLNKKKKEKEGEKERSKQPWRIGSVMARWREWILRPKILYFLSFNNEMSIYNNYIRSVLLLLFFFSFSILLQFCHVNNNDVVFFLHSVSIIKFLFFQPQFFFLHNLSEIFIHCLEVKWKMNRQWDYSLNTSLIVGGLAFQCYQSLAVEHLRN